MLDFTGFWVNILLIGADICIWAKTYKISVWELWQSVGEVVTW